MNPRSSPGRVLHDYPKNQIPDLFRRPVPSNLPPDSGDHTASTFENQSGASGRRSQLAGGSYVIDFTVGWSFGERHGRDLTSLSGALPSECSTQTQLCAVCNSGSGLPG